MGQPLMVFKSHVGGKNSDVVIFADRVEWGQTGWFGTGSKVALGVATMGLSLLKTGVRGAKSSEMIPIKSISSVTVERDGFRQKVNVFTSGNTIEFRCGRDEAEKVKSLLTDLILGRHPAQNAQPNAVMTIGPPPPPAVIPAPDASAARAGELAEQFQKLAQLRDSGILSDEEFQAAKARLLSP